MIAQNEPLSAYLRRVHAVPRDVLGACDDVAEIERKLAEERAARQRLRELLRCVPAPIVKEAHEQKVGSGLAHTATAIRAACLQILALAETEQPQASRGEEPGLREALAGLVAASEPYIQKAAPHERPFNAEDLRNFHRLNAARRQAEAALAEHPATEQAPRVTDEMVEAAVVRLTELEEVSRDDARVAEVLESEDWHSYVARQALEAGLAAAPATEGHQ